MIVSAASNPDLTRSSHNFDTAMQDIDHNHLKCCLPDWHSGPAVTPLSAGLPRGLTAAWQHGPIVVCMLPHSDQYPASSPPAVAGSGPAHHGWSEADAARPACPLPACQGLPELLTRQRLQRVAAHGLLQARLAELHQVLHISK